MGALYDSCSRQTLRTESADSMRYMKVVQQLSLRCKRAGRIMEDYAWLCINARMSNALISAEE
jgi:hypothetical protein